jgi:hypothetical protein
MNYSFIRKLGKQGLVRVDQVVQQLPSKYETLSSNPSSTKKKKSKLHKKEVWKEHKNVTMVVSE